MQRARRVTQFVHYDVLSPTGNPTTTQGFLLWPMLYIVFRHFLRVSPSEAPQKSDSSMYIPGIMYMKKKKKQKL